MPRALRMRQIEELSIWIGTARDARDIKNVLSLGIKTIVDLALEEIPVQPTRDLVYLRFPLMDGTGNPTWLIQAVLHMVDLCIRSRVPTLIACGAGMSRSPSIAAIAAAPFLGVEPADVLLALKNQGPIDVSSSLWQELMAMRS
jgi:protein-tyrosine phosphatase